MKENTPEGIRNLNTPQKLDELNETLKLVNDWTHKDPSPVIDSMEKAVITSWQPEHRYQVTDCLESLAFHAWNLPTEITDEFYSLPMFKIFGKVWNFWNK